MKHAFGHPALGWLRTAAKFEALKARRKLKRHAVPLDDDTLRLLEPHWDAHEAIGTGDLVDYLRECLAKLTDKARKLLTLRYTEAARRRSRAESAPLHGQNNGQTQRQRLGNGRRRREVGRI